jgi:hypothetical protein
MEASGVLFTPTHNDMLAASWDRVIAGIEKVISMW